MDILKRGFNAMSKLIRGIPDDYFTATKARRFVREDDILGDIDDLLDREIISEWRVDASGVRWFTIEGQDDD
jgi:hypothetical protein